MEDKVGRCARPACSTLFQGIEKVEKGKRHHLERKVVQMEAILNLCASKETVYKDHAKKNMMC
jgi:hypothetical protein